MQVDPSDVKLTTHIPVRPSRRLEQGMVVAFSVALDGTADLFPDTPQVRDVLKRRTSKKYLGVVSYSSVHQASKNMDMTMVQPGDPPPLEVATIKYVSYRPPPPYMYPEVRDEVDVSQLCAPLAASSTPLVSSTRSPLQLSPSSPSFPFTGAYVFTNLGTEVIAEYIHGSSDQQPYRLPPDEAKRFHQYVQRDAYVVQKAYDAMERREREKERREEVDVGSLGEADEQAGSFHSEEPETFLMPSYELIYDIWLDVGGDDILLDPEGYEAEILEVKQAIESTFKSVWTEPAPMAGNKLVQVWAAQVQKDDSSGTKEEDFYRGLRLGFLAGLGFGTFVGSLITRLRRVR